MAAAAATLGLGAASTILGGIFGAGAIKRAGSDIVNQQLNALNDVHSAVQEGQAGIGGNVTNAQQGSANAVDQANSVIGNNASQILAGYSPYTASGQSANSQLAALGNGTGPLGSQFNFTSDDLTKGVGAPGFQFTLDQGMQAIQKAAAAQGGLFSTGTLKSLTGYAEGTANQYSNTAYQQALQAFQANQQSALNRAGVLQNLSGTGLAATSQGANALQTAGLQQGQNLTQGAQYQGNAGINGALASAGLGVQGAQLSTPIYTNIGNAQAGSTIGATNSLFSAINNGTNALTGYLNMLGGGRGGGGGGSSASTGTAGLNV
jgi:hypothetical protein